jgi:DNA-binding CsgD family transcriptional regulator
MKSFDDSPSDKDLTRLCDSLPPGLRVRVLEDGLALLEFDEVVPRATPELTPAERAIALALFSGDTNAQIAATRGVHVKTVAKQVEAVYRKLGVGSRAELVLALAHRPAGANLELERLDEGDVAGIALAQPRNE